MNDVARPGFAPADASGSGVNGPAAPAGGAAPGTPPAPAAPAADGSAARESASAGPDPRAHGPLPLPDRGLFWRWVWHAVRPVIGWVLAAIGALALFLGWYGVSGEALTAKQLPYLVSGGLTGIGLIVLAGVFLATEDIRRQLRRVDELQRKVDDLYSLFVADIAAASSDATASPAVPAAPAGPPATAAAGTAPRSRLSASPASGPGALVALPNGTSYHRPDCSLVAGKDGVVPIGAATIRQRGLKACRVCDPAPPPAG